MTTESIADPKLLGQPITKRTICRVGGHAFIWNATSGGLEPSELVSCDCGAYTYEEWRKVVREEG